MKRLGTVYKKNILSGDRTAKIRSAIAAVDRLPETSNRRIAARRVVEEIEPRRIGDEAIAEIRANVPGVESIGFRRDLEGSNAGRWIFSVVLRTGSGTRVVTIDPLDSSSLLRAITEAIAQIP